MESLNEILKSSVKNGPSNFNQQFDGGGIVPDDPNKIHWGWLFVPLIFGFWVNYLLVQNGIVIIPPKNSGGSDKTPSKP